jgi:putative inorganic carbon (HCO3(-)) transporter
MFEFRREDLPLYLTGAAAVCSVVSIAAMEILVGLAVLAMLLTRHTWKAPRNWLPLSLFFLGTVVSLVASGQYRQGYPQVKKFYIYFMLFLVTSAFRSVRQVRWIAVGWAIGGALSSAWALNQFFNKYMDAQEAHKNFYTAYVADRITGFTDHWMTFSGEMMIALLMLAALLFFGAARRWNAGLVAAGALMSTALIAAETRSVWLATGAGAIYLMWFWKRWTVLSIPAIAAVLLLTNPLGIGDRVLSIFEPHGELDSNAHRAITRGIGVQMIKAHPLLGIGPEQVGRQYMQYLPPGTHLPLPPGYYNHLHNIYIHYAAELGVPAMLAMLWMLLQPLYDFTKTLRTLKPDAEARWVLHGSIAVLLAILIGGYFEKNIGDSEVLAMFLASAGCGYVAVAESERSKLHGPGR